MTFFLQVSKRNLKKTKDLGKPNHAVFEDEISWYTKQLLNQFEPSVPMLYSTMIKYMQGLSVLELDLVMQLTKQEITSRENAISEISLNHDEEKETSF